MHRLCLFLFLVFLFSVSAYGQEQIVKSPEQPRIKTQHFQPQKQGATTNTLLHKFVCQRCGSENQLDWGFPADSKNLQLIPHCNFCGKKYWPKFKPTGLLERTYSRAEGLPSGLRKQQRSL